jgi:glycosyltransferase involved in cell wall biosynthesis
VHVLYLVPDLFGPPGGIARYCRLVTRALCESGCVRQLDVVALWDADHAPVDARYLFGPRLSYTPAGGRRSTFIRTAVRLLEQHEYDLVVSALVGLSPLLFVPSIRNFGARRVTFIYGLDAWYHLPWRKRVALRRSDVVISNSQHTATRATRANGLDPSRLRVLYGCLDPELESGPAGPGTEAPRGRQPAFAGPTIVTVSRLMTGEDKGHVAVLRALPSILREIPDLHYVIVGDGNFRPALEDLARSQGVAQHTHFVGSVSDAEVASYLDASQAFVMPSRIEGFGFVFLEALAHGLPVIAGTHDAAPEVLGPDAGVMVDTDDVQQVGEAVVHVLEDADLRARLVAAGRRRLDARFRYPAFRETLLAHLTGASVRQASDPPPAGGG